MIISEFGLVLYADFFLHLPSVCAGPCFRLCEECRAGALCLVTCSRGQESHGMALLVLSSSVRTFLASFRNVSRPTYHSAPCLRCSSHEQAVMQPQGGPSSLCEGRIRRAICAKAYNRESVGATGYPAVICACDRC